MTQHKNKNILFTFNYSTLRPLSPLNLLSFPQYIACLQWVSPNFALLILNSTLQPLTGIFHNYLTGDDYSVVKWSCRMVWLGIMYSIANQWVQIMNYQLNILHWKRNVLEGSWTFRHIMTLTRYSNTPIINYTTITWSYPVNRLMDCQGCLDQNCIVPTNAWTGTIQFIIFFIFSSYIKDNRSEIKNLSCSHNFVSGWRVPKNIRYRWHNNQLFLFVFQLHD